jgi:dihydroorotate dehydrogenase electron transfer subunit
VERALDPREALAWADYLALDVPPDGLDRLRDRLGLDPTSDLAASAQVLISMAMPCGWGACGACAVKARRGWKLACKDGPVFDLNVLEW